MNEPRVQRIHRRLMGLMQNDGDRCSMCRAEFPPNSITYGGLTITGAEMPKPMFVKTSKCPSGEFLNQVNQL
jgi:hypothetical protein